MHPTRALLFMSLCVSILEGCRPASGAWLYADKPSGFVQVDPNNGARLTLNDREFRFSGFNSTTMLESEEATEGQFRVMKDLGSNALRIWGFWNGGENSLQPELKVYNEERWRTLDYVLATAARYDVKVIVSLANYWDEYGGLSTWNRWAGIASENADANERERFYDDEKTRELYEGYVDYVVNRTNSLTGVRYKDDPTIMMWEPINEARGRLDPSGKMVQNWLAWSSGIIKKYAPHQLVGSGAEGFFGSHPQFSEYPWQAAKPPLVKNSDGSDAELVAEGSYVDMICSIPTIDLCSIHAWPDHWFLDAQGKPEDFMKNWIEAHLDEAKTKHKKPVYLGEFGWGVNREAGEGDESLATRYRVFESAFFKAGEEGASSEEIREDLVGLAIWNLASQTKERGASSYDVRCPSDGDTCDLIGRFNRAQIPRF